MIYSLSDDTRQLLYFECDNFIDKAFFIEIPRFNFSCNIKFKCMNKYVNEWFKPNLNNKIICLLRPF